MPAEVRTGQVHNAKGPAHARHGHVAKGQAPARRPADGKVRPKSSSTGRKPMTTATTTTTKTTTVTTTMSNSKQRTPSKGSMEEHETQKAAQPEPEITSPPPPPPPQEVDADRFSMNDNEAAVMETRDQERVHITQAQNGRHGRGSRDDDDNIKFDHSDDEDAFKGEYRLRRYHANQGHDVNANGDFQQNTDLRMPRSNLDVRTFNANLDEFVTTLSDPRYQELRPEYPVDDLISVISMVSANIEEYKEHTQQTQQQLTHLRHAMKTVRENLHLSITRQAFELTAEEDQEKSNEELALRAKLARLNQTIAEAHQDVAEATRLTAETEHISVQAHIASEQARLETERIQEELALKAELERQKEEEEERARIEEESRRAEEKRRREEERLAQEEAKKRKEEERTGYRSQEEREMLEKWQPLVYTVSGGFFSLDPSRETSSGDVLCVVRANPATYNIHDATCQILDINDVSVAYGDQDELISRIFVMNGKHELNKPKEAIYVAIAYTTRLPSSREAVVLAKKENGWEELVTNEVSFEGFKEYKFAQARVETFTTLLVMSRFKREFLVIHPSKKPLKLASSYDQRVTFTLPKNIVKEKEDLVIQVQPVDSATVSEFRTSGELRNRALLTSSPILHTEWQTQKFKAPITITLPCPPNPAKAKKLAALKKQKEEKMKTPPKPPAPVDDKTAVPKTPKTQKPAEAASQEDVPPTGPRQTARWYMGQYGQTDDDENDMLCFIGVHGGKFSYNQDIKVINTKIDMVSFDIENAYDKMLVLRVRTDVEDDQLKLIAQDLIQQLAHRSIRVLLKQKADDPYDVCVQVVPAALVERAEKVLKEENYTIGPDKYAGANVKEGETIAIQLRGNLKFKDAEGELKISYNSNMPNKLTFHVGEVDRYLQKTFDSFRGAVRVSRQFYVMPTKTLIRPGEAPPQPILKSAIICDVDVDIPKDHIQPDPIPTRVPVTLHDCGSVDAEMMRALADELGEEWTKLAQKLHISRVRLQSIVRQVSTTRDADDSKVIFEMLMTWLKRCPQAADKIDILSLALESVGRRDLAQALRTGMKFTTSHTPIGSVSTNLVSKRCKSKVI